MEELERLSKENVRMDLNQSHRFEDLKRLIVDVRVLVEEKLHSSTGTSRSLADVYSQLHSLASTCTQLAKEQKVLSTLCFKYMRTRVANITKAHTKTFDWIFDPDSDVEFVPWLETHDGIYWISGKPGSGKSTLMKYLFEHKTTQELLSRWAGDSELITASFFFWSIGTQMQKSQEGLLRSLIFSILKQCPGLMAKTGLLGLELEHRDNVFDDEFWTLGQLQATLGDIIAQEQTTTKFCFFIDGLDEYVGHHPDIVRTLDSLAQAPFIKICASSRPWNVFEDAYGHQCSRKLYLEDLTKSDIEIYVRSSLEKHNQMALMSVEGVGLQELVDEIVMRAQGVFLWVHLVLLSLDDGLTNGDDVDLLQYRLSLIPTDLEEFFRLILDSVDPVYKEKMAQIFQVILQTNEPLTLLTLSFLDQRDLDARLQDPTSAMDVYEIGDRIKNTKRRINGRYKGLLEIEFVPSAIDYFNYKVDFFHRTVHDFIRLNDIQQLLHGYLPPGFNSHETICKIILMTVKKMALRESSQVGTLRSLLDNFISHARLLELERSKAPYEFLDEMETTVMELSDQYQVELSWKFMDLAILSGLQYYVLQRFQEQPEKVSQHIVHFFRKLLQSTSISLSEEYEVSCIPEMIESLLSIGVSPNEPAKSSTVFGEYLLDVMHPAKYTAMQLNRHSDIVARQFHLLVLLLKHGADPNAYLYPRSTVWESFLRLVHNGGNRLSAAHQKVLVNITKSMICYGADVQADVRTARGIIPAAHVIRSAFTGAAQQILLDMIPMYRPRSKVHQLISFLLYRILLWFRLFKAWCVRIWGSWRPQSGPWHPGFSSMLDEEQATGITGLYSGGRWANRHRARANMKRIRWGPNFGTIDSESDEEFVWVGEPGVDGYV